MPSAKNILPLPLLEALIVIPLFPLELPITKSKTKEEAKQTLCQFHNKVNDDLGKPTFNCNTWSF